MKKLTFSLLAGLMIFAWVGSRSAQAQMSGFYIEPKLMYSYQHLGNPTMSFGSLGYMDGGSKGQSTWGGALSFGFNFQHFYDLPLRMELEYAMRSGSSINWAGWAAGARYRNVAEIDVDTLFFNVFWDIPTNSAFTPYLGAGLGLAFVDSTYRLQSSGGDMRFSDDQTNFAWNIGAGVGYAFDDHWTASLGYRFSGFGESKAEISVGADNYVGKGDLYGHEVNMGLRYSF